MKATLFWAALAIKRMKTPGLHLAIPGVCRGSLKRRLYLAGSLSRSSRRRILPTFDFGNSLRNSMKRGRL